MRTHYALLCWTAVLLVSPASYAGVWQPLDANTTATHAAAITKQQHYTADPSVLRQQLTDADRADAANLATSTASTIELPMPDGSVRAYRVQESPVMAAELAAKYPQLKTYKVFALDGSASTGRLSISPLGFHAYVHTDAGVVLVDPIDGSHAQHYRSYFKHDVIPLDAGLQSAARFSCGVHEKPVVAAQGLTKVKHAAARTTGAIRNYRLAVATTGEYSAAVAGADAASTLAEVVVAINRVNEIYERNLGIHFNLVANNDVLIYTDGNSDPYTNDDPSALLDENQSNINAVIGASNYDIGHVFSTGGGGLATRGVVCSSTSKARGETGLANPVGDEFYIDYVAHEIGHQFGADHSFNGITGSCGGGTRVSANAFEPGSGSTIMAYAGLCSTEDVQNNAEATFHAASIVQILDYVAADGSCSLAGANELNQAPEANAGADYTIPGGSYFELTGSAMDADPLLYQWDQFDLGVFTTSDSYGADNGNNPLFRSFAPSMANKRVFPQLATILSGAVDKAEVLPVESRTLNFRLSVRDGNGGVDEDDMQVTVDSTSGPFEVLQPNAAFLQLDSTLPQTIQWDTACTEQLPVNCATVDIWLSTDSGNTYPHVVVTATENAGEYTGMLPVASTGAASTARIRIQCTNNIFFDVSDNNFEIAAGSGTQLITTTYSMSCGTGAGFVAPVGDDSEPNSSIAQADTATIPDNISGTVNTESDDTDYFVITALAGAHTFTLTASSAYDLDLELYDSNFVLLDESVGDVSNETISRNLSAGAIYYIVVRGFDTESVAATFDNVNYQLNVNTGTGSGGGGGGSSGGSSSVSHGGVNALLLAALAVPLVLLRRRCYTGV